MHLLLRVAYGHVAHQAIAYLYEEAFSSTPCCSIVPATAPAIAAALAPVRRLTLRGGTYTLASKRAYLKSLAKGALTM